MDEQKISKQLALWLMLLCLFIILVIFVWCLTTNI